MRGQSVGIPVKTSRKVASSHDSMLPLTCQDCPLTLVVTCQDSFTATLLTNHDIFVSTHNIISEASVACLNRHAIQHGSSLCLVGKVVTCRQNSGMPVKHAIQRMALTHILQHQCLGYLLESCRANVPTTCLGHVKSGCHVVSNHELD